MRGKDQVCSRRRFLRMLGAGALLSFLTGCHANRRPLTIAASLWPGYELMFLAAREGWFPQNEVNLLETSSNSESLQKVRDGVVDGAALTLHEVLRLRSEGIALSVVLVLDVSAGADVVMARPGIRLLADLRGKRVGVEYAGYGAFMLYKVCEAAGVEVSSVAVVPMTIDHHLAAWRGKEVDAVITYEPVATRIEALGGRRIFDSRQIPGTIVDVLAIRQEALGSQGESLRMLVLGHFKASRHLRTNPQDAAYHMANRMNIAPKEVLKSYSGLELPGVNRNRELLGGKVPALLQTARPLSTVMTKAGLLLRENDLAGLFLADFLPPEEL